VDAVRLTDGGASEMDSMLLIVAALAAFALAYRFYANFLAAKVAMLNDLNKTPAHRLYDGVDYVPTNKWVLFGHHFAAIAGPGPLIGPVLAAQFGFLPGALWIIIGAALAGAVHDFIVLVASVRNDGLSLANLSRSYIGRIAGIATSLATLFIITTALAGVSIAVVNALSESPWGVFTILVTIPAAILTGQWMYRIRPGKVAEASLIGIAIVMLGVLLGHPFQEGRLGLDPKWLTFDQTTLKLLLPTYAFIASVLPVWFLMCPRDYLSSYMKAGVAIVLGIGVVLAHPPLQMPAITKFIDGSGPVLPGQPVWPFVCITIMCGAISGFHSLIASGTTPKMIYRESDIKPIAYGAMLLEGFVAVVALIAACALHPDTYFAINAKKELAAQFAARSPDLWQLTKEVGEKTLVGRTGGAVSLAVGMTYIFRMLPGMQTLAAYWYHFAIMFEALFILTLVETGTRVARFIFQETITPFVKPALEKVLPESGVRWGLNIFASALCCLAWGYLLFTNDISTIWPMFGIANQLLAAIGLAFGTTYILTHAPKRLYALCTFLPLCFVFTTTMAAGIISVPRFWSTLQPPANVINAVMTMCMLALTVVIIAASVWRWMGLVTGRVPVAVTSPSSLASE